MSEIWYDDNSHQVRLEQLRDLDGTYVNDAAVTVTFVDASDVEIPGVTWPLVLTADGTLTGTYTAPVPETLEVDPYDVIYQKVVAQRGAAIGTWRCKINVRERSC